MVASASSHGRKVHAVMEFAAGSATGIQPAGNVSAGPSITQRLVRGHPPKEQEFVQASKTTLSCESFKEI